MNGKISTPEISVIIPLYNGSKYITKALASVAAQTFRDYEIVICDDGSKDDSRQVVQEYIGSHPELVIKYVYQDNKGLGGARNTAIRNAAGEIFALLDQDDFWVPGKLKEVFDTYRKYPEIDVVCHNEFVRNNGKIIKTARYGPIGKEFFRQLLFQGNCLSTSAIAFRRRAFDLAGPFSEDVKYIHFVEDYDLWLKMAADGCNFYLLDKTLGEYALHDDNHSIGSSEMMCRHKINVINKHYSEYKDKRWGDPYRIRKRRAQIYLAEARDLISGKCFFKALPYIAKCFAEDPAFILNLVIMSFARFWRIAMSGRLL